MDGLRCDEIERIKHQIAAKLGATVNGNRTPLDPVIVAKAKGFVFNSICFHSLFSAYLESASPLHLDRVFGGTLLQSVECKECGHISQRIEPFLDISLPICDPKNALVSNVGTVASPPIDYAKVTPKPSKHQKKKDRQAARKVYF